MITPQPPSHHAKGKVDLEMEQGISKMKRLSSPQAIPPESPHRCSAFQVWKSGPHPDRLPQSPATWDSALIEEQGPPGIFFNAVHTIWLGAISLDLAVSVPSRPAPF